MRARGHARARALAPRVHFHVPHRLARFGVLVQGAGCRVQGSGCRVQGSGFRVQGSGFRVQGGHERARALAPRSLSRAGPPDAFRVLGVGSVGWGVGRGIVGSGGWG